MRLCLSQLREPCVYGRVVPVNEGVMPWDVSDVILSDDQSESDMTPMIDIVFTADFFFIDHEILGTGKGDREVVANE